MSLKESLKEMEHGIDREILLPKTSKGVYKFDYDAVAKYLRDSGVVFIDNRIYKYTGCGYAELSKEELKHSVARTLNNYYEESDLKIVPFLTNEFSKVYSRLETLWTIDPFDMDGIQTDSRYTGHLVAFRNGLYNVTTDTLLPHTPNAFVMERFDFDYDPSVTDHPIRAEYESIVDGQDYDTYFAALGRTLFSRSSPTFMAVIQGSPCTGKTTLYRTIEALCEENSYIHISLRDLSPNSSPSFLKDKLANLDPFVFLDFGKQRKYLDTVSRLVLGKEEISHKKYAPKESIRNSTPLWFKTDHPFSKNELPNCLAVRTYCIHCRHEQERNCYDMVARLMDIRARQWVVNEALRMFRKYGLTPFDHVSKNSLDLYLEKIGDATDVMEHLDGRKVTEIYEEYLNDLRPGQSPLAKSQFLSHIKSQYGLGTRHKSIRIGDKVTSINIFCKTD